MSTRLSRLISSGLATARDLEGASLEQVAELKASGPQVRAIGGEATPLEGRRIRYVWSTEAVDRMGDIVRQNWDLGPFTRNPVSLWNHDHDVVLGRAIDFGVQFAGAPQLVGTIEFAPEGIDPLIDSRYKLAAAGYLPGTSVGFLPTETRTVRDSEERAELGLGDYGVVFERNQLLEISVVSVPANPEAIATGLAECVERGVISPDEAEIVARDTPPTERDLFSRLERLASSASVLNVRQGEKRVALIEVDGLYERFDRIELQLAQLNTLPQGDAHGVGRQVDKPGSGSGWDWSDVLDQLADGVSRGFDRAQNCQTSEGPHGKR